SFSGAGVYQVPLLLSRANWALMQYTTPPRTPATLTTTILVKTCRRLAVFVRTAFARDSGRDGGDCSTQPCRKGGRDRREGRARRGPRTAPGARHGFGRRTGATEADRAASPRSWGLGGAA